MQSNNVFIQADATDAPPAAPNSASSESKTDLKKEEKISAKPGDEKSSSSQLTFTVGALGLISVLSMVPQFLNHA
ncbi:Hypothetical protein SRAE_1000098900 [Strongyloides ratti]|uniref:Uncharacterized protein n=1 Tax=Strongyloides ratti TaxID=34506 RepID=A0A090L5I7_STRRB|nr:Hypothetical protein SRAE_1000098900 [Strongyloides ratti]CEF62719.1 Hypothetical protein SRAE_1000098900 [Strongyloides ratti]